MSDIAFDSLLGMALRGNRAAALQVLPWIAPQSKTVRSAASISNEEYDEIVSALATIARG